MKYKYKETKKIIVFVWYFEKEKSYGIESFVIDTVLNKEHLYAKTI